MNKPIAGQPGYSKKKVKVSRGGKTFERTQWVKDRPASGGVPAGMLASIRDAAVTEGVEDVTKETRPVDSAFASINEYRMEVVEVAGLTRRSLHGSMQGHIVPLAGGSYAELSGYHVDGDEPKVSVHMAVGDSEHPRALTWKYFDVAPSTVFDESGMNEILSREFGSEFQVADSLDDAERSHNHARLVAEASRMNELLGDMKHEDEDEEYFRSGPDYEFPELFAEFGELITDQLADGKDPVSIYIPDYGFFEFPSDVALFMLNGEF